MVAILRHPAIEELIINDMIKLLHEGFEHKVKVVHFPDLIEDYSLIGDCVLLVRYSDTSYGQANSLGDVAQESTATFTVSILTRSLYGDFGAHRIMNAIHAIIKGSVLQNSFPATLKEKGFVAQSENFWHHDVTFELKGISTALIEPEECPVIKEIQIEGVFTDDESSQ